MRKTLAAGVAALAATLGQTAGEPLTIREDQSGWWSSYGAGWGWRSAYTGGWELGMVVLLIVSVMVYAWLMFLAFESRTRTVYEWMRSARDSLQARLRPASRNSEPLGQVNEI